MKTTTEKMFVFFFTLFITVTKCLGQMMDPYMAYGGGMALYGGLNPYLYNGMGYNQAANMMYNPYNMDMQSAAMLANYNAMSGVNYNAMNGANYNAMSGVGMNPLLGANTLTGLGANTLTGLGANTLTGFGNSNILDSGNTLSGLNSLRGFRNRLPTMSRDGIQRMPSSSMFGCGGGMPTNRPCGQRNIGAGTQWENTHDNQS